MIEIITGDLLDAKEKYLLHQTNCISTGGAAGLAKTLFQKYPYADCYTGRSENSIPGTIDVRGDGINERFVINLHGQFYPGKPKYPYSTLDGVFIREKYFYRGLLRIAQLSNIESIAVPWRVGAGLAGGTWETYLGKLTNFANYVENTQGAKVVIYRREEDV